MIRPIHTCRIRGVTVRLFAAPQNHSHGAMPWCAADDLVKAMDLRRDQRFIVGFMAKRFPADTRRAGTPSGMATLMSFGNAKALVEASIHQGYTPASILQDFVGALWVAAQEVYPEMFRMDARGEMLIDSESFARLIGTDEAHVVEQIEGYVRADPTLEPRAFRRL